MWFKVGVLFVLFYLVIGNNSGYSQNNLVKGKVLDAEMNSPLPGANVFLKGNSTIGATTDLDGNFLIKIPAGDQILVFSYLGFKDLEKEIKGGKDENISLVIKMELTAPVRRGLCLMHGEAYVGDRMVCEADMMAQVIMNK